MHHDGSHLFKSSSVTSRPIILSLFISPKIDFSIMPLMVLSFPRTRLDGLRVIVWATLELIKEEFFKEAYDTDLYQVNMLRTALLAI